MPIYCLVKIKFKVAVKVKARSSRVRVTDGGGLRRSSFIYDSVGRYDDCGAFRNLLIDEQYR